MLTIGEALNRALRIEPALSTEVTSAAAIVSFRNLLIHGYDIIDDATVWDLVQTRLPHLLREASEALQRRRS